MDPETMWNRHLFGSFDGLWANFHLLGLQVDYKKPKAQTTTPNALGLEQLTGLHPSIHPKLGTLRVFTWRFRAMMPLVKGCCRVFGS